MGTMGASISAWRKLKRERKESESFSQRGGSLGQDSDERNTQKLWLAKIKGEAVETVQSTVVSEGSTRLQVKEAPSGSEKLQMSSGAAVRAAVWN